MGTDKPITQPVGSVPSAREAPPPLEAAGRLAGALHELYRALHKTSIYPMGHPTVRRAIAEAGECLATALEGRPRVLIGVARDHLLVDRIPLTEGPQTLGALAQFLHALDIALVELRAGFSGGELERFLLRLREARRAGKGGATLALALAEDKLESVRIFPIDYWGLSFSSHADPERGSSEPSGDIWEGLVVTLTELASSKSGVDPEALAEEANQQLVDHEGVGAGLLRKHVHALGDRMRGMDEWQREALRARLGRFVTALNPELRRDLLRIDPRESQGTLSVLTEIADTAPDTVLIDVLRDLNRRGERIHDHLLNFMNKMARLPWGHAPQGTGIEDVLSSWGVSSQALLDDPSALRSALKEVFLLRKQVDCNPETYQELLEDLTHRELPPATRLLLTRYRDPQDLVATQVHAVEIAVRLLGGTENGEHTAGMLGYVGTVTDPLLEAGEFQPVRDAVVAARSISSREEQTEEARRAAEGYLRDFTLEARIDRILSRACKGDSVPLAAEHLIALGGVGALDRIVGLLDSDTRPGVASVLQSIAVQMGPGTLARVLEARAADGWPRLRPAIPLIRLFPSSDGVSLLEPLAAHRDSRVRREALTHLCELDSAPGSAERHLRRALGDEDLRLVAYAIQQLAGLGSPESIETLGAYLEGSVPGVVPWPQYVRRVAKTLIAHEDAGLPRLCRSLQSLRLTLRPRWVRVGAAIEQVLRARCENPQVGHALRRWRLSPAGFVSLALALSVGAPEDRE